MLTLLVVNKPLSVHSRRLSSRAFMAERGKPIGAPLSTKEGEPQGTLQLYRYRMFEKANADA